ncbi:cytochrome d ubiquinol oxidase subunit II, partial [Thioclava sp. BHET1]
MDMLNYTQQFLAVAWWIALCISVLLYIALDGADLGAGIFSLFVTDEDERGAIMSAMAGTWDANETWLIVAGGILFGTFPFVYGSSFSYLMVPLAFVLWGIMA